MHPLIAGDLGPTLLTPLPRQAGGYLCEREAVALDGSAILGELPGLWPQLSEVLVRLKQDGLSQGPKCQWLPLPLPHSCPLPASVLCG